MPAEQGVEDASSKLSPALGVVIVTFCSAPVIDECLESLLASEGVRLKVVVVDNDSPDGTVDRVRSWASGDRAFVRRADSPLAERPAMAKPIELVLAAEGEAVPSPLPPVTLIRASANRGFAAGVNIGLRRLAAEADVAAFWVLNPDCAVHPRTARQYLDGVLRSGPFSLMTGRTVYYGNPDCIQTDGGKVNRRTGLCVQINNGAPLTAARCPRGEDLDWVTGANMVVSRAFLDKAGFMPEDYFLYYEEVDWAHRRGELPILTVPDALVYHHGGSSTGAANMTRRSSPFTNYFNHRNRIRFVRRFFGRSAPFAYAYGFAKAAQLLMKGAREEAHAIIVGMMERPPPKAVLDRVPDPAARAAASCRPPS